MSIVVPSSILRHTISNDFSPVRGLHDVYSVTPHNTFRYNRNNFLPQTALGCIRNGVIRSDTNPPSPLEEPSQAPRQCIVLLGPRVRLGVAELVPHVHAAILPRRRDCVVQKEGGDHGDRHVGREDSVHDAVELHESQSDYVDDYGVLNELSPMLRATIRSSCPCRPLSILSAYGVRGCLAAP